MSFIILVIVATICATFAARTEDSVPSQGRMYWTRSVAYWLFTILVAFEMTAGGIWDLLRIEYVRVALTQLGYPVYLSLIIGPWKIPCAVVLLVPRFQRLKEWAYAGAFFNYTGAAASHLLAGNNASKWVMPLFLAGCTLASWALRPAARRLAPAGPAPDTRMVAWLIPVLIAVAMLAVAVATLPKGPPPS